MNIPEINKQNYFTELRMFLCTVILYEHAVVLSNSVGFCLNIRAYAVDAFFLYKWVLCYT